MARKGLTNQEISAPDKLSDDIRKVFSDRTRPGCPCVFTQEQIMEVIDLACKAPSDFGYEVRQWNLNLLVKEIRKQGIAEDISAKSVSRIIHSYLSNAVLVTKHIQHIFFVFFQQQC